MSVIKKIKSRLSTYRNRALALLVANLLGYLLIGSAAVLPGISDDEWVTLDQWVRTAVFAVVRPSNTTPVTYVDIDNSLYRDAWGMPTVTPRDELVRILSPLTTSGAAAIVVDIDVAWGEKNDEMESFLTNYSGPAPLIFVRHLEESGDRIREIASPYDEVFATNDKWLHWAHSYFFSDGDGALREWIPWLAVCENDKPIYLPAVATTIAGGEKPANGECSTVEDTESLPIIYTEEYGFASVNQDEDMWFPDPKSPARKLPAKYLLDGTRVDLAALLDDRVAIVGGSHTAGQDLRLTPLGVLPGAVVQANTVIHAKAQLVSAESSEWSQRIVVAALFCILSLIAFPFAAVIVTMITAVAAGAFSHYAIFTQLQLAALLFIQFRVLVWLAEPFWKEILELRWHILIPDYLRDEEDQS